ncbi:hypothetical protein [Candidatus Borrarchaeum sp.]|uniref:hypothetical protein n=1 Tax=Candidatus Borrarchaeum sp. TaxID=2846742 RepID=UPI00257FF0A1|nr:hypothetical protein [Candidatus Borrarchaeum sp.]
MAKKRLIPWELKYKFAMAAYSAGWKGWLYAVREECGAATTLKIFERVQKLGDRVKHFTNFLLTTFKLEGNDIETIIDWWDIWWELCGIEGTSLLQSQTFARSEITQWPFKTEHKDISDWCKIFTNIVINTINPKATFERPRSMCAGDSYCEYVMKIEE